MAPTNQGSIRLGRVAGIELYLHWSWFIVALIEIQHRAGDYTSPIWNVLEYLALFGMVLLHEFGHSLACRQVGGRAERIVLWPLGGVAYVDPPQRPGAMLWSLAAGPLVNVVLAPVILLMGLIGWRLGAAAASPNLHELWVSILGIDLGLLIFNLLPMYPLDGGQILRSLLWYFIGPAWSLMVATIVGLVGVAAFALLALALQDIWLGAIAVFILWNCWNGLRYAVRLIRWSRLPRHQGLACPACGKAPPVGAFWVCSSCRTPFDTFESQGICPNCRTSYAESGTRCPDCGQIAPITTWTPTPQFPPPPAPLPTLPQ